MPTLEKFTALIEKGKIRNNLSQAAGWLIILGAEEYKKWQIPGYNYLDTTDDEKEKVFEEWANKIAAEPRDWKVGSIEPTTEIHGDIEYLYTVDVRDGEITIENAR